MRNVWRALAVMGLVTGLSVSLSADEKPAGEKPAGEKPAGEAPKGGEGSGSEAKREEGKGEVDKKDHRTRLPIPVTGLSDKTSAQLVEKLSALSSIEEVEVDLEKKRLTLVLKSEAECLLSEVAKALQKGKADVDLARLTLNHPCTITLKGEIDGTRRKDEREKFKRNPGRAFNLMAGQKLLDDLKGIEGVRSAAFPDDRSIKLGFDRDVPLSRIADCIADRGDKDDGSNQVADIRWVGEKQGAQRTDRKGAKDRGSKDEGGSGAGSDVVPEKDSGLK